MNRRYNIPFIILITLLAVGTAVFLFVRKPETPAVTTPVIVGDSTVHYFCTEGTIDVVFKDSSASFVINGSRILSLDKVPSGSGIRYEENGVVFASKGSNAYLEENGVITYNNCVENAAPTDTSSTGPTKPFTDQGKTFSFSYPKELSVTGGEIGYSASWRNNTQTLGLTLAKVVIPKSSQPNTNFSDSWFMVGTSSDPVAVKECLIPTNGERAKGTAVINGVTFNKITFSDAGMSQYYDTTSYRAIHKGQCYAIEYTLHSVSMGVFAPEQGIKEFDTQKVVKALEGMAQSFKFTD